MNHGDTRHMFADSSEVYVFSVYFFSAICEVYFECNSRWLSRSTAQQQQQQQHRPNTWSVFQWFHAKASASALCLSSSFLAHSPELIHRHHTPCRVCREQKPHLFATTPASPTLTTRGTHRKEYRCRYLTRVSTATNHQKVSLRQVGFRVVQIMWILYLYYTLCVCVCVRREAYALSWRVVRAWSLFVLWETANAYANSLLLML